MPYTSCKVCSREFRYNPSQGTGETCSTKCRGHLQNVRLMESGTAGKGAAVTYLRNNLEYKCYCCGIDEWNGKAITLQIDHIDGDPTNNTINNVRWLCPNCHTQTDNWGFKNASTDARARSRQGAVLGGKIKNGLI